MNEPVIQIDNLAYTYPDGQKRALSNLTFEINRGEYVALLGANGAGKTTLSLHMNGILPLVLGGKMGGTIHVLGKEPYEHHVYENAHHVGMVLQDPEAQLFSSDVRTEVAFAAENRGMPREEMLERIGWALNVVRLSDHTYSPPNELSGGQKQRLVIASNLVVRPEILVLDEPTSQLDPVGTSEVFSTLRDLNKNFGMTIFIATHAIDQAAEYADRILVLEEGKLIAYDKPRKVFFQADRMRQALVNIPEVSELNNQIRDWGLRNNKYGLPTSDSEINVNVSQVKQYIEHGIKSGDIHPASTFQVGLGRHVPEKDPGKKLDPVLEVHDVGYTYSKNTPPAIHGINLTINRGEVVAMIGQNGAGKTTLMKCITGALKPTSGRVTIDGRPVSELDALSRAKLIGLILQNPDNQLFRMSAEEEIAFGLENQGISKEEIEKITEEVLALTGMEKYRQVYPFKLSLGDRRKLAVASIYAMHPSILIFDEPTTGQDYQGRYQLCDLAMRLNRLGATIIMITHDMSLVAKYTQRTLVMGKGTILLDAPTREVFSHRDELSSTFLEPPPIVRLAQELQPHGVSERILTVDELYNALTGDVMNSLTLPSEAAQSSPAVLADAQSA